MLANVLVAKPNVFTLLRLKKRCCAYFTILSVWVEHFRLSVMCTLRNVKLFSLFNTVPSMWMGVCPYAVS
jgi:hypothetical protein